MYLLIRFTPIISSIFLGLIFIFGYFQPAWLLKAFQLNRLTLSATFNLAVISALIILSSVIIIGMGVSFVSRLRFIPFIFISWLSAFVIFLYSDQPYVVWPIIILIPAINWVWLESLYLYWQRPEFYQPYSLQRIANYFYLLEIFLFITAVIGLQILMQVPIWMILILAVLVLFYIQYDYLLLHQLDKIESLIISLLGTILAGELYLVLNLLPTHFFMYGILISIFFYLWLGIGKQILRRNKELKYIKLPMILGGLGAIAIFITSFL